MVRYPQKKPSDAINPPSEGVSSKPETSINENGKDIKDEKVKDEKVEELQQRLQYLERKLIDIQSQGRQQPVNEEKRKVSQQNLLVKKAQQFSDFLKKYKTIFVIGLGVCLLALLAWVFMSHLYAASFALELNPKEFNFPDQKNGFPASGFVKLEEPPYLIDELVDLDLIQIKTVKNGKYLGVRIYALGEENSRQKALSWRTKFIQKYVAHRKAFLMDCEDSDNKEYIKTQHDLEDVFEQMAVFKSSEKYFLINETSKEKLIQLAQENALNLERDLMGIKDQLVNSSNDKALEGWSKADKVSLEAYRLKLIEMEFNKFLVGGDFLRTYEEGMRPVKTAASRLINDQAQRENIDEISASLIIKDFFLNCRLEAIEAVLNKRYVTSVDELYGHLSKYFHLKSKFETLNLKGSNILLVEKEIKAALAKGFSKEVIDYVPLKVTPY